MKWNDGFDCSKQKDDQSTLCEEICGDGKLVGSEDCDDKSDDDLGCKKGCKSGYHE